MSGSPAQAGAATLPPPPASLLDGAALFLDFDGTLVELAETPAAIRVPPGLPALLKRLQDRLGGRLGIVSGRSIANLERHLDCTGLPVSGSHGFELRLARATAPPPSVPAGLGAIVEAVAAFVRDHPGTLIEKKPAGAALHFRQAPELETEAVALMAGLAGPGFTLQHGKMVAELRAANADKGSALRAFMAAPEFAGARPVFVGDDATDEDAFTAAAELGGAGVLVGPPRASAASWRLADVDAVAAWLAEAAR